MGIRWLYFHTNHIYNYMSKIRKIGEKRLQQLLDSSNGYADVLRKVGLKPSGSNPDTLKKIIKEFELDTSKMDKNRKFLAASHGFRKGPLKEILTENSSFNRVHLKNRLLKERFLEYKCYKCDLNEWKGKFISLHLDHINGVNNDNRLGNLRLLCPNCHSQTETYARKNGM